MTHTVQRADCLKWMRTQPANSVDLVFGSPPYEDARTYGRKDSRVGQVWVSWMVEVVMASLRVSRGLVAFVVEGRTRKFRWSATPALLMADLHRAGVHLRKPPAFNRVGIPGQGGPDWLRNDYEFIVCATSGGKLPWSDNIAMGHPPKWAPGGEMSHRLSDGTRRNQWGHSGDGSVGSRRPDGTRQTATRPGHRVDAGEGRLISPGNRQDGKAEVQAYLPPVKANPGNVIHCLVGGGVMGSALAHDNVAPFPESLAEWFVRSWCPEGGVTLDPFAGSGTVAAVCERFGRDSISVDHAAAEIKTIKKRILEARKR